MRRYLCVCILYISCVAAAYAQASPPPKEVDVVYFKDGGVLRGEIVGRSAKTGKIQLRDGSVIVYKKSDVRMSSRELLQASGQGAREDSLKIAGIAKKVLAEEAESRRAEEELRALQLLVDANMGEPGSMPDDDRRGARLYSVVDAGVGIGFGDLPFPGGHSALVSAANTQKLLSVCYAVGGRGDHFGMGLAVGLQQLRKDGSFAAQTDTSGATRYALDSTPSNLLFLPVGLDMRLEFLPEASASPFISVNTAYAVPLNPERQSGSGFFTLNPAAGLRFGRTVSSLLSVGFQLHVDVSDGSALHFLTLRFGLTF